MAYEIDYIPVGDGEKSGDAITLRFGNLSGPRNEQTVVVIDGGFEDSGETLVNHIKHYYKTDEIDLVISTHPDADHASGLYKVLDDMKVKALLMHKPWDHASEIKDFFKNKRITVSGLEERIEKSLQHASDLESLAIKKGIPIYEPFQGLKMGEVLHILGPSEEYYQRLLTQFRSTPTPVSSSGFLGSIKRGATDVVRWIEDNMHVDLLDEDDDTTSAENNTSAIILFNIDGHKLLFTGDAGKTALIEAINYANGSNLFLSGANFFHVPHHGSKRNLNSKIIKGIKPNVSFISASKGSPKHPAKKVTNALQKHGSRVFVNNKGQTLMHHYQGLDRGWGDATPEPFHVRVEE